MQQLAEACAQANPTNITSAMIHWDNSETPKKLHQYKKFVNYLVQNDITLGLSGVKQPENYQKISQKFETLYLEGKNNLFFSDLDKYKNIIHPAKKFFSYGISVSGLKIDKKHYNNSSSIRFRKSANFHDELMTNINREKINTFLQKHPHAESMYQIGIILNEINPKVYGYIIAPKNYSQLNETLCYKKLLSSLRVF